MELPKWLGWFLCGSQKRRDCLRPFRDISWYGIDIDPYLERFSKPVSNKDGEQLKGDLGVRLSSGRGRDRRSEGPYRDASFTMALYKHRKAGGEIPEGYSYLCCIGFDVDGEQVVVKQIQGYHGQEHTLCLFKWERMLLAILTDWAKENGYGQIRVIRAQNSDWYREKERMQRMFMHYDITARRSGFAFDRSSGQYVKVLA